jgi:hypothetical protein
LLEKQGNMPIVLDSKYLLQNPGLMLKRLCNMLEISFDQKMLRWEKGAIKEDGIWAKHWYANVHNSSGFLPYTGKKIQLSGSNVPLAKKCKPYYEFLTAKSIQL